VSFWIGPCKCWILLLLRDLCIVIVLIFVIHIKFAHLTFLAYKVYNFLVKLTNFMVKTFTNTGMTLGLQFSGSTLVQLTNFHGKNLAAFTFTSITFCLQSSGLKFFCHYNYGVRFKPASNINLTHLSIYGINFHDLKINFSHDYFLFL